jgi:hypothetical protein
VEKYFQNVIFKGLFDIFRLGSSAMLITNRWKNVYHGEPILGFWINRYTSSMNLLLLL